MPSYDVGKDVVVEWIRKNFNTDSRILDVGACDGKWKKLLPEYRMDAVEIWEPYCKNLTEYENVYNYNIVGMIYEYYDLIIFGDVIEHMTVEEAQQVIKYAYPRCKDMIVAVPFLYPQEAVDGNPWQAHKQPELTADLFAERYPSLEILHYAEKNNYCYYHKRMQ